MVYSSLEQRMAQNYIDMLPSFVPDESAPVSVPEQEKFYTLMKDLYRLAFDEPQLFVASLHEDDAYPHRFNKSSYGKPGLMANMKKFTRAVGDLLKIMFLAGQSNDVSLNNRQQMILSKVGIADFTNLPSAWKWMSNRDGANVTAFSHCLFSKDYSYTSEIYARLLGEEAFKKLESWMLSKGYLPFDSYNVTASDCKLWLTIANPSWDKNPPRGGFEFKIKHTGISAGIDPYVANPPIFGLCIPNGMKPYLEAFDTMDKALQSFVVKRTAKCRGCRYCVQTDKTGLRPMAYIPIEYQGEEYKLCTYFPGFNYCWTYIDDDLVEELIRMLSFMDRFAPNK